MTDSNHIAESILETIAWIGQKEAEMEILRQELNH
jgi:hypothetical protein